MVKNTKNVAKTKKVAKTIKKVAKKTTKTIKSTPKTTKKVVKKTVKVKVAKKTPKKVVKAKVAKKAVKKATPKKAVKKTTKAKITKKTVSKKAPKKIVKKTITKTAKPVEEKIVSTPVKKQIPKPVKKVRTIGGDLKKAGIIGTISLLLTLLTRPAVELINANKLFVLISLTVFTALFSIIYLSGFAKLGMKTKNPKLTKTSQALMVFYAIDAIFFISIIGFAIKDPIGTTLFLTIYALLLISFGKGLVRIQKIGDIPKIAGSMNMAAGLILLMAIVSQITGFAAASAFLAGTGLLIAIIAEVANIIVLFKAAKKY